MIEKHAALDALKENLRTRIARKTSWGRVELWKEIELAVLEEQTGVRFEPETDPFKEDAPF